MAQPRRFLDLVEIYSRVQGKIQEEQDRQLQSQVNKAKSKRYGR